MEIPSDQVVLAVAEMVRQAQILLLLVQRILVEAEAVVLVMAQGQIETVKSAALVSSSSAT